MIQVGGKYIYKPTCYKQGRKVPILDHPWYGKKVKLLERDCLFPDVVQIGIKDEVSYAHVNDLREIERFV